MIDIIVDELINSIRNRITGDVFDTNIIKVDSHDFLKLKRGWNFDWIKEASLHAVYKLTIDENPDILQGLISIREEDSIVVDLIESASFNIGENKVYEGVPGNLFGFACQRSFQRGYKGAVSFIAKTNLIEHYKETLGAKRIGNSLGMIIDTEEALHLIDRYYGKEKS